MAQDHIRLSASRVIEQTFRQTCHDSDSEHIIVRVPSFISADLLHKSRTRAVGLRYDLAQLLRHTDNNRWLLMRGTSHGGIPIDDQSASIVGIRQNSQVRNKSLLYDEIVNNSVTNECFILSATTYNTIALDTANYRQVPHWPDIKQYIRSVNSIALGNGSSPMKKHELYNVYSCTVPHLLSTLVLRYLMRLSGS